MTTPGVARGLIIAVVMIMGPGILLAGLLSLQGPNAPLSGRAVVGPNGEAVKDEFMFVHRSLVGDGTITARVVSMTGLITYPPPHNDRIVAGVMPWAKAGIIMKKDLAPGASYVAMMVTGTHGVRMQYNFTGDVAGSPRAVSSAAPLWLRLTRTGNTFTGYASTTGKLWTRVATIHLANMPPTLQVGLFVTSPHDLTVAESASRFTSATAVFDNVSLRGQTAHIWRSIDLGAPRGLPGHLYGHAREAAGRFSVTGSGDMAPVGLAGGWPIERGLLGTFLGISAVIAVVAIATRESTQAVDPRPQRGSFVALPTLAAQGFVVGTISFAVGGVGALIAVLLSDHLLRAGGDVVLPVPPSTEFRVILGTALLVALAGGFAVGVSALIRRRGLTVTAGIVFLVVPYALARVNGMPVAAARWLLRVTPAAGFAIQQSLPAWQQTAGPHTPQLGYYPLAPWVGIAVTAAYTVLALSLAALRSYGVSKRSARRVRAVTG